MPDVDLLAVADVDGRDLLAVAESDWSRPGARLPRLGYNSAAGPEGVPDLFGLCDDIYGTGDGVGSSIWLRRRQPGEIALYLGVVCGSNRAVDAAYAAAIKAGGIDEGKPAERTYFAPGYYAANVADFDGSRLEFVHKAWNPEQPF